MSEVPLYGMFWRFFAASDPCAGTPGNPANVRGVINCSGGGRGVLQARGMTASSPTHLGSNCGELNLPRFGFAPRPLPCTLLALYPAPQNPTHNPGTRLLDACSLTALIAGWLRTGPL